jgi:hypothetical protein
MSSVAVLVMKAMLCKSQCAWQVVLYRQKGKNNDKKKRKQEEKKRKGEEKKSLKEEEGTEGGGE